MGKYPKYDNICPTSVDLPRKPISIHNERSDTIIPHLKGQKVIVWNFIFNGQSSSDILNFLRLRFLHFWHILRTWTQHIKIYKHSPNTIFKQYITYIMPILVEKLTKLKSPWNNCLPRQVARKVGSYIQLYSTTC